MQPRNLLIAKKVLRWLEPAGVIECAHMEMRLVPQLVGLARQCRAAGPAETARRAGRRLELGDLAFGHRVSVEAESNENGYRPTAVPTTALAMTPEHSGGPAPREEPDGAAEASAFEPVGHDQYCLRYSLRDLTNWARRFNDQLVT
jgi:hypothetical protein